ncbi:hypothetical protein BSKO_13580 [Bryopsis sp. KO-2023]|nr:hypothetical protein BSKO_13580 [Bryopsis sp. KO-2023]
MESLKKEMKGLLLERDAIEKEIQDRTAALTVPGGPGLEGNLIDKDGFPRQDIDIPAVRNHRHRIAVLTNDHKSLSEKIEKLLHSIHQQARDEGTVSANRDNETQPSTPSIAEDRLPPFAVVDSVSQNSPAVAAGIEVGDQLCRFGSIIATGAQDSKTLSRLAQSLKDNEGKEVVTIFMRRGVPQQMTLVPKKWGGPGLIGCHLRPLQ